MKHQVVKSFKKIKVTIFNAKLTTKLCDIRFRFDKNLKNKICYEVVCEIGFDASLWQRNEKVNVDHVKNIKTEILIKRV